MTRRVEQLDLLRFVAAVCVVAYHLLTATEAMRSVTRFGWIGVPLFFMISGFVIAWTAQNRSAYGFIAARISRLYPSFWVAVLLTSVVLGGVPWQTLLANLTMIPKPLGAPRIDDVYWTLEAEILFYGFILALIVTGQIHRLGLWLGVWLAVCAVGVVVPLPDVVTLKGFAPFFVSGGFFFLLRSNGATLPRSLGLIASTFLCVLAISHHEPNFMRAVTPATHIVSVGFVIAAHAAFLAIALKRWTLPESPVWYWLGSLTYPLYLVHNEIGKRILETLPFGYWANISITLACVFALSAAMAVLIEQRACKILHRLMRPAARLP